LSPLTTAVYDTDLYFRLGQNPIVNGVLVNVVRRVQGVMQLSGYSYLHQNKNNCTMDYIDYIDYID